MDPTVKFKSMIIFLLLDPNFKTGEEIKNPILANFIVISVEVKKF